MTEALERIKKDYPGFGFYDGNIKGNSTFALNSAKVISCDNPMYWITIHDHLDSGFDYLFVVVATQVNGPIHYIKKFSTFGGLRLYLGTVMAMGI